MLFRALLLFIIAGLAMTVPASAITVPLGDTLQLSGSAPGADTVFLFLTGPNLPANGVRLDDISIPVVTGVPSTFVRRPVAGDGSWEYSWITRTAGGVPDAGTYTVYAVTTPTGRKDLSDRYSFAVISVTLTRPTLYAVTSGGLTVSSDPPGALVKVDGELRGTTPLELADISPGNHTVGIQKDGYQPVIEDITVRENETIALGRTLEPLTASPVTVPVTSPQPTSIGFPMVGLFLGLATALQKARFR
jgi:hypothetical protein